MFFKSRWELHRTIFDRQIRTIRHLSLYLNTYAIDELGLPSLYDADLSAMNGELDSFDLESRLNRRTLVAGLSPLLDFDHGPVGISDILGEGPEFYPPKRSPIYMPLNRQKGRGLSPRVVAMLTAVDAIIRLSVMHFVSDRLKARLYAGFHVQYLINVSYIALLTGSDEDANWTEMFRFFDDHGNTLPSPNFNDESVAHLKRAYRPRTAGGKA